MRNPQNARISRFALYVALSGWVLLVIFILTTVDQEGFSLRIIYDFLSTDDRAIRFRALMLCGPFITSVLGYYLNQSAKTETQLRENEEKFEKIAEKSLVGIYLIKDGIFQYLNPQMAEIFGYSLEELLNMGPKNLVVPEDWPIVRENIRRRVENEIELANYEFRCVKKDGTVIHVQALGSRTLYEGGPAVIGSLIDITDRKLAEERTERQLRRLASLRKIDTAISSSLDLGITLEVFIREVLSQLQVDAACVLLLNPHNHTLEHAASKGFRGTEIESCELNLGEGVAGNAALERKPAILPDLEEVSSKLVRRFLLTEEGFRSYFAIPLIAKGQVKGVLEAFHRTPIEPEMEWLQFLEALAGQVAIAIDDATMFTDLQRSRDELAVAYERTIEGWAKALDYRDKETEGHSQRVTEMTVRIAHELNMDEEEIVHLRRGALLHDIGKLGVPDKILFKPGKLDEEEWKVMKRHPDFARELLYPIKFLRASVDIPYCHHERWDGTGYPRGLKGEQIPPSARIFAVVDVWDALISDRVYRKAWPRDKVLEFLQENSGSHFDPEVVEVFMRID